MNLAVCHRLSRHWTQRSFVIVRRSTTQGSPSSRLSCARPLIRTLARTSLAGLLVVGCATKGKPSPGVPHPADVTSSGNSEFPPEIRSMKPEQLHALADYLAARLGCARAAVIAPGLATRLVAADVKEELANRTAALLESMVAARYGGGQPEDATNAAREVVDALEAEFRRRGVVAAPGPRP